MSVMAWLKSRAQRSQAAAIPQVGQVETVMRSLSSQIAGAAVVIVAVAIVFVVIAAARYNEGKTRGDLEQKMVSLTAMIAHAAPPLILARDTITLSYILESLKRDPDFDAGIIADDIVALATAGRTEEARLSLTPTGLGRLIGRDAWSALDEQGTLRLEDQTYVTQLLAVKVGSFKKQIGYVALRFDKSRLIARAAWEQVLTIGLGIAVLVVLGPLLWFSLSRAMRPLQSMTRAIVGISDGKLDTPIDAAHRHDEIGAIARALGVLKLRLAERATLQERQLMTETERHRHQKHIEEAIALFRGEVGVALEAFKSNADRMGRPQTGWRASPPNRPSAPRGPRRIRMVHRPMSKAPRRPPRRWERPSARSSSRCAASGPRSSRPLRCPATRRVRSRRWTRRRGRSGRW